MRYRVRQSFAGREVVSPAASAELAVRTATALAGAGRHVIVTDETGRPVDLQALTQEVLQAKAS